MDKIFSFTSLIQLVRYVQALAPFSALFALVITNSLRGSFENLLTYQLKQCPLVHHFDYAVIKHDEHFSTVRKCPECFITA